MNQTKSNMKFFYKIILLSLILLAGLLVGACTDINEKIEKELPSMSYPNTTKDLPTIKLPNHANSIKKQTNTTLNPSYNQKAINFDDVVNASAAFVENKGQLESIFNLSKNNSIGDIKFFNKVFGGTIYYGDDGVLFGMVGQNMQKVKNVQPNHSKLESRGIQLSFLNKNPNSIIIGENQLSSRFNYIKGKNQNESVTDIHGFKSIEYKQLYKDIDLKYYRNKERLKYDFIVHRNGKIKDIKLQYQGIQNLSVNINGELEIETTWGKIVEGKPYTYQIIDGKEKEIKSSYHVSKNTLSFTVGSYDESQDLIIDPPTISWVTYLTNGGLDNGYVNDVTTDDAGNVYVIGWGSNIMPSTSTIGTASRVDDMIVYKVSADGTTLDYATIILGNTAGASDIGMSLQVNASGEVYGAGFTTSTDFPVTNEIQSTNAGANDIVFFKLNATGSALDYASYFGGTGDDAAFDLALYNDTAYITGVTFNSGLATAGAYDNTYSIGYDGYILKINPDGSQNFFTYYGGTGDDYPNGIDVDDTGEIYIGGATSSNGTGMTTVGAYQTTNNGITEGFVAKFSKDGSTLHWGTYIGGCCNDWGSKVKVNSSGHVAFMMLSDHASFPTKLAHQSSFTSGADGALVMFGADGDSLIFSTWIGGLGSDNGAKGRVFSLTDYWHQGDLDLNDSVIVLTFESNSSDLTLQDELNFATVNSNHSTGTHAGTHNGGYDYYVAIYEYVTTYYGNNLELHTGSYLGGSSTDYPTGGVAIIPNSECFVVAGSSHSNDFPTTNGVYQESSTSGNDQINVSKVCDPIILPVDYLTFFAQYKEGYNSIYWATISEKNNAYFEVLRSYDGKNFEKIGAVNGAGYSFETLHYEFKDYDPLEGIVYYRLKQVDTDGKTQYSKVISISSHTENLQLFILEDRALITSNYSKTEKIELAITNIEGKLLYKYQIDLQAGTQKHFENLNLSSGVYIISVFTNTQKISKKYIKI